jgi:FkbM family methyltransferase
VNFSAISNRSPAGRLLRLPLALLPKAADVRILQGPLRNRRWRASSSNHGCWLGSFEHAKQREVAAAVRPGMVCFDVGANVGYYTLLFSTLCGSGGQVAAFEPLPGNCDLIRYHLELNGCSNARVEPVAVTDFDGPAHFTPGSDNSSGHLAPDGPLVVPCTRLDTFVGRGLAPSPDILKIDVEGAEMEVIEGAAETLRRSRPMLFVAAHDDHTRRGCRSLLDALGYRVQGVGGVDPDRTYELVATHPAARLALACQ